MRYIAITPILVLLIALFYYNSNAENVIKESPSYLFVISGASGSLDGDKLTLNGVPNVVYFTDRPARQAGHISKIAFLDSWHKGTSNFDADPPNAALSILGEDDENNSVIELMNPEFNEKRRLYDI